MKRTALGMVLVALVLGGCSDDGGGSDQPRGDDVLLRVVSGSEVARDWTLDEIRAEIEFVEIVVGEDPQTGPRLEDLIAASGIEQWETAVVYGMSEGRVLEVGLDIEATTIDETWVFDVTKRDTLKLAAPDLPREQWVRDVGELRFP